MREWVEAIRAIGRTWQDGDPLEYVGEHTRHTLMTPAFEPGSLPSGPPPIWLGALGPALTRLATTVADGKLIHPFTSDRHLADVTLPRIRAGLEAAERPRSDLTVVGQAIVACATDPATQAAYDPTTVASALRIARRAACRRPSPSRAGSSPPSSAK